jgi:hypothetical protein
MWKMNKVGRGNQPNNKRAIGKNQKIESQQDVVFVFFEAIKKYH